MWHDAFGPSTWSNWLLVIVGIGATVAALLTLRAIWRQTVATEKTLVLTQRPRIVVRNFYFSEPRAVGGVYHVPKEIEAGSFCSGQFYIVNLGGTQATTQEIYCTVFLAQSLPMKRPYEGLEGSTEKKIFQPGQSVPYLFGLKTPLDEATANEIYHYGINLCVLGWIGYTDDLGIWRITAFCRQYDTFKKRFVPVDNTDYENSD
jgi:hypothetical protein